MIDETLKHCMCGCIYLEKDCPNCNKVTDSDRIKELEDKLTLLSSLLKSICQKRVLHQTLKGNLVMRYYILLRDELGEEFGVTMYAPDIDSCLDKLELEYPESTVVSVHAVNMGI